MENVEVDSALKAMADFESRVAFDSRSKAIDEHNAAFRWLLASLFALNGGAAIALFGKDKLFGAIFVEAAGVFLIGVICCFLMAILGQISDRKMIAMLHAWGLYWIGVSASGVRLEGEELRIRAGIEVAEQAGRNARVAGIFSMSSFVAGCLLIGRSILP